MELYFSLSALFNAVSSFILGFFVYFKNKKARVNQTFALFCLCVFTWSFAYFFWPIAQYRDSTLFWFQMLHIGAIYVSITYLHFVASWLGLYQGIKKIIISGYFLATFFVLFVFSPLFIKDMIPKFSMRYWAEPGVLYHFYLLMFFGYAIYASYLLFINYKKSTGIKRAQMKYILIGMVLAYIGGSTNYPLWYNINFPPYGNILASAYVIFSAYAILKYRFMDIRIVAKKIFIYLTATIFTYIVFYLVAWFYIKFFGGIFTTTGYLTGLVIAPVFVAAFYGINKLLKIIANKYLFYSLYSYQQTINNLTDKLTTIINLDQIIDLIVDTIRNTMLLDRSGVLLIDESKMPIQYQIARVTGFKKSNGISLVKDNFLTKHLTLTQKPLVKEELDYLMESSKSKDDKDGFSKLKEHMTRIEASLCLPLISKNKLSGIIVLGAKVSGDAYTKEDLELLNVLSNQAAIAIDNARLYKQVQDFNQTLQQKVDEQTKDIKEKSRHLQQLLDIKNDFLRVANHQLNTPLSVVRNAFELLQDKTYNSEQAMAAIQNGFDRLNTVVGDFLKAYDLEGERMEMKLEPVNISAIIEKLLPEKQKLKLTQERKLQLSIEKPKFKIPQVFCDAKEITDVISNLLDNAVFYTNKGSITISYEMLNNDFFKINVKDTGVGITDKDKKKLFKKFVRGQGATQLHPDGSGLGLYIAKKIIEGHNGEITVKSQGENKGSTFSFTLPVYKNQKVKQPTKPTKREKIIIFE